MKTRFLYCIFLSIIILITISCPPEPSPEPTPEPTLAPTSGSTLAPTPGPTSGLTPKEFNDEVIIKASYQADDDFFGGSVSLSGDYAIIGAVKADSICLDQGQAYIFKNDGTDNWDQIAILAASDQADEDLFGMSVSLSGDYAVVGAPYADSGGRDRGQAYVFKNDGVDNWDEIAILAASDQADVDEFGWSVCLFGNYAIIGAVRADSICLDQGQAYIFKNDGTDNWDQIAILAASDQADRDYFGMSVSLSGDYAVVGAFYADSGGRDRGQAYVFKNDGADSWDQIAILAASDQADEDLFGWSVSLSGDYAVVGAPYADSGGTDQGQAYIFKNDGADNWDQIATLTASKHDNNSCFGTSVCLSGDYIIVGDKNGGDDGEEHVYVFENDGADNWNQIVILTASDGSGDDSFGMSVSLSGDYAIVGAKAAESGGFFRGQAYIFY